jgi:geranylgeranyl diphosphate synthase, type II
MNEIELRSTLAELCERIDAQLDQIVPAESIEPSILHKAIRWSLFAGGKRLRPALMMMIGNIFGSTEKELISTACAIEMIHTYSLIHDDLPSMDDDDMRRGRPTCHVQFGEATAILAGDGLQALAFQTIAEDENLTAEIKVRLIKEIALAAGTPHGMVAGQSLDLEAEDKQVDANELEQIHRHKTGAIITASARCGAIIGQATDAELFTITQYAASLGLLFQITDDLLDVTATAEDLGKTPGKDKRSHKATYPALYGIESSRHKAQAAYETAMAALNKLCINSSTQPLQTLAHMILDRRS